MHARRPRPLLDMGRVGILCSLLLIVAGCATDSAGADPSPGPSGSSASTSLPSAQPSASIDPESLCLRIDDLELSVARLRAIDLKLTNRVPLDIEVANVRLAFDELKGADLGEFEDELDRPLQRLDYRMTELELAVEDFRTNTRPRRATPHVQDDARTFADEVASFRVLARC
jgi:hypothetical protein